MSLRIVTRVAVLVLVARGLPARGQATENLDFESRENDPAAPDGWFVGGQGYEVKLDEADPKSGKVSLRMRRTGARPTSASRPAPFRSTWSGGRRSGSAGRSGPRT